MRWDHSPAEIMSKTHDLIAYSKKTLNDIINLQDERTFENTIQPIAEMEARSGMVKDPLNFYKTVHPDKAIRDASKTSSALFTDFHTEFWMRKDFFHLIDDFTKTVKADGSIDKLESENRLYLERLNEGFQEIGINQPEEKKQKIKALSKEIAFIGKEARSNIDED